MTPPTVPMEYIRKHCPSEYALIQQIEKGTDWQVVVKDFSCTERLPVVGVIIQDLGKMKYRLNVGSDTSFTVSLSRCLTEIHQGIGSKEETEHAMLDLPQVEHDYFFKEDDESIRKRNRALLDFTRNGTGVFPRALFEEKETYAFDPTIFTVHDSYEDEVKYLIKLLVDGGHDVYLRDVSFLGFPSYMIYVPYVSPIGRKTSAADKRIDFYSLTKFDKVEDLFFPFDKCSGETMRTLAEILDNPNDSKMKDKLKLEFLEETDWDTIPVSFFLTLMWYTLDEYDNSVRNLKLFMETTKNEDDEYFNTILRYIQAKKEGKGDDDIRSLLSENGTSKETIDDVVQSFSDKSKLFSAIDVPVCPHCDKCNLVKSCMTKPKMDFTMRINRAMAKNMFLQEEVFREYAMEPVAV
jgi:hypothetical protein